MTTRTETTTGLTTEPDPTTTEVSDTDRVAAIGHAVTDAADTVKGAAADAASRLPDLAASTRDVLEDVDRQMHDGSDEMLTVGSALSFGVAAGMFLGGMNRILVIGAMVPAVMMVLTMLGRSERAKATSPTSAAERRLQGR